MCDDHMTCDGGHMTKAHLDEAEHAVVQNQRGVAPGDDGADQDGLDELPRGHQHMEPVAAVLHTRLQDLGQPIGRERNDQPIRV